MGFSSLGPLNFVIIAAIHPHKRQSFYFLSICVPPQPYELTGHIQARYMFGVWQFEFEDLGVVVVGHDLGELQINEALVAAGEGLCHRKGGFCNFSRLRGISGSLLVVASEE